MKRTLSCQLVRATLILLIAVFLSAPQVGAQGFLRFYPNTQPAGADLYLHQAQVYPNAVGYQVISQLSPIVNSNLRYFGLRQTDAQGLETQPVFHLNVPDLPDGLTGNNHEAMVSGNLADPGHVRLVKRDLQGQILWDKTVAIIDNISAVTDVKMSDNGEIFVSLFHYPLPQPTNQSAVTTTAKLDAEGNLLWVNHQNNYELHSILNRGETLTPAQDGGCFVHYGEWEYFVVSRLAANGGVIWRDSFYVALTQAFVLQLHCVETAGGGMVVSGIADSGYNPTFAKSYAPDGQLQWDHWNLPNTLGLNNFYTGTLVGTNDGGVLIVGQGYQTHTSGTVATRFTADGTMLWQRHYDDLDNQPNAYINFAGGCQTSDGSSALAGIWTNQDMLLKIDANGRLHSNEIIGTVAGDQDLDCLVSAGEQTLPSAVLQAIGANTQFWAVTGADGQYTFQADTGNYVVKLQPPSYVWQACADSVFVNFPDTGMVQTVDFPLQAIADCQVMTVDVVTPRLRRCFPNAVNVYYCNLGSIDATDVVVNVTLDQGLDFDSASLPGTANGQEIAFPLGTVAAGYCGSFYLLVTPNCDSTQLDDTKCITAHISPDSICGPFVNWSGASMEVTGYCAGDSVRFTIKNTGPAASSTLDYVIIEDHVIMMTLPIQLAAGESKTFAHPANGHTVRVVCQQEPGNPVAILPSIGVEACGSGLHNQGFLNQFPNQTGSPFDATVCRTIIGSFDPNDKRVSPEGVGEHHWIENNTDLDYLVNFQNTGTDTAFRVIVLDTLSPLLDPFSITGAAASAPFTWKILENNVLRFTLNDLTLPDSNANEAASHGFIRFKIKQKRDLPDGLRIENRAAIFFDYNPAVLTNTVFHTIGRDFLETSATQNVTDRSAESILIAPNPASDRVTVVLKDPVGQSGVCRVVDYLGRTVANQRFAAPTFELKRNGLAPGVYWLQICPDAVRDAHPVSFQKIIWQ